MSCLRFVLTVVSCVFVHCASLPPDDVSRLHRTEELSSNHSRRTVGALHSHAVVDAKSRNRQQSEKRNYWRHQQDLFNSLSDDVYNGKLPDTRRLMMVNAMHGSICSIPERI